MAEPNPYALHMISRHPLMRNCAKFDWDADCVADLPSLRILEEPGTCIIGGAYRATCASRTYSGRPDG
jgi:hypothetical protein